MAKKMDFGPTTEMGENWPKNGKTGKKGGSRTANSHFSVIFPIGGGILH